MLEQQDVFQLNSVRWWVSNPGFQVAPSVWWSGLPLLISRNS